MASRAVSDAVLLEMQTAFPLHTVRILHNEEDPEPPRDITSHALVNGWFGLEFPGATESLRSLGDPGANYWTEDGAFLVHVFIPSGVGTDMAAALDEQVKDLFRGRQIGPTQEINILDLYEADAGDRFGGNWYGVSRGFAFRRDFIG